MTLIWIVTGLLVVLLVLAILGWLTGGRKMKRDKIVRFVNARGKWQWRLVAPNGEILAHSEDYNTEAACEDTIRGLLDRNPNMCVEWNGKEVGL